jgi:hypothetical protein
MTNLLGYAASCTVLATFLMRTMVPLRLVAILSNVLFLGFGYLQHIYPVLFLHLALLPINAWRLVAVDKGGVVQTPVRTRSGWLQAPRPYAFWFAIGLLAGLAGSIAVVVATDAHLL